MSNEELLKELVEMFITGIYKGAWKSTRIEDLSNLSGVDIKIFPENAKNIDEVKSFEINEDVQGTITYKFKRV